MFGWFSSGAKPKEVSDAEKCFTPQELQSIQRHFKEVACISHSRQAKKGEGLDKQAFLHELCGLPKTRLDTRLGQALFNIVQKDKATEFVTIDSIVVAKARCERMGDDVTTQFCFQLLSTFAAEPAFEHSIPLGQLQQALAATSQLVLGETVPQAAAAAAGALTLEPASGGTAASGLTIEGYSKWSKAWPALHALLSSLLRGVGAPAGTLGQGAQGRGSAALPAVEEAAQPWACLPQLLDLGRAQPSDLLMQPFWVWMLSSCMPPGLRQEWRCLFNSQRDGKSFNTLMGRLAACQGPSLLLLKDAEGYTFGGFAPAPWAKSGSFFGDYSTFIFRLLPAMQIFRATGINDKFQWCGLGFSQLPNGLGFGGAQGSGNMGQFALYVDSTLDSGMSRPIATFGNDPLGSEQVFQVSVVECWQLCPNEEDSPSSHGNSRRGDKGSSSVLDKMAQDRHLLGMAGVNIGNSDGLRPEPPIE